MNFQALEYGVREMVASITLNRPERMNAWTAVLDCARPPFAMERLRNEGIDLLYRCPKQHSEPATDKRGAKVDEPHLTRLEPIDRIAALAPPLRKWKMCCTPCTTTKPSADTGTRLVFITRHIKAETNRSLFAAASAVTAGAWPRSSHERSAQLRKRSKILSYQGRNPFGRDQ